MARVTFYSSDDGGEIPEFMQGQMILFPVKLPPLVRVPKIAPQSRVQENGGAHQTSPDDGAHRPEDSPQGDEGARP